MPFRGVQRAGIRVPAWRKTQELRSGECTLWDQCFELPGNHLEAKEQTIASVCGCELWLLWRDRRDFRSPCQHQVHVVSRALEDFNVALLLEVKHVTMVLLLRGKKCRMFTRHLNERFASRKTKYCLVIMRLNAAFELERLNTAPFYYKLL